MSTVNSLRVRVIKAGSWIVLSHLVSQFIRLGSNMVMTRMLVPEYFGIMVIANTLLVGLAMFSDLGLRQNIIQSSKGEDRVFLNTAWSVQIIRGFVLGLICCVIASGILFINKIGFVSVNNVYSTPVLPWVILVLSLNPIISGFESTKLATENRALSLGRITFIELFTQVLGISVMFAWAFFDRSVWALVVGGVCSSFTKTCLSHLVLHGEHNNFHWDKDAIHEIVNFGKWIFLTSILGFFVNNGDRLLLGGLISSGMLGVYSVAIFMVGAIQGIIFKLIGNVTFPALGEIKRLQPERVRELYYKIRRPIDIFCLFSCGFLFLAGQNIIKLLYDDRYIEAGVMLEILALSLAVVRFGVAGQFFLVLGKPKLLTVVISIRLASIIIFVVLGYQYNYVIGAVWGLVVANIPELFFLMYVKKIINILNVKKELIVLPFFILGLIVGRIFNSGFEYFMNSVS